MAVEKSLVRDLLGQKRPSRRGGPLDHGEGAKPETTAQDGVERLEPCPDDVLSYMFTGGPTYEARPAALGGLRFAERDPHRQPYLVGAEGLGNVMPNAEMPRG